MTSSRFASWARAFALALGLALTAGTVDARTAESPKSSSAATKKPQKTQKSQKAPKAAQAAAAGTPKAGRTAKAGTTSTVKPVAKRSRGASSAKRSTRATTRTSARKTRAAAPRAVVQPAPASYGRLAGLHQTEDPLDLHSSVALVVDQDTHEVLVNKNAEAVLPIASLTKLMTALVVTDAAQSLDEVLTITQEDVDTEKGSGSRLKVGTQLSRGEMLHLALMSSENRAANALGRHYPGGMPAFVAAMNAKARLLGMVDTHYAEPTGLSSRNQSSARDLARLVNMASSVPLLRELSTSPEHRVQVGQRELQYHTTNRLVLNPQWNIGLQKTGYISEAGRCLVMQARFAGRQLIMVLLDSAGRYSRLGDAERIRRWVEQQGTLVPAPAPAAKPAPGGPDVLRG